MADSFSMRKPDWLKVRLPSTAEFQHVRGVLRDLDLHSVCREAKCPNIAECFHSGTATFLILGNTCTRRCKYCNVRHGRPDSLDDGEPERVLRAASLLGLSYVVITSVTRDDLPDGGAGMFARCIDLLRRHLPDSRVEVLVPDFQGDRGALERVIEAGPDVINHNVEVAGPLFAEIRPEGNYPRSLELLRRIKAGDSPVRTKSGFMVGLGESTNDIRMLIDDLSSVSCDHLTVGQYLQPTRHHWPVQKYYSPEEFEGIGKEALARGFRSVESGPLVRSSYRAAKNV